MLVRPGTIIALGLVAGLVTGTACSDYDDGESPADASVEAGASTSASSSSSGTPADAASGEGGAACAEACDCDRDGFQNASCVDASDEAGAALVDCDDNDPLRHPQAELSGRTPTGAQTGDWDCDGVVERSPAVVQVCTDSPVGCVASPPLANLFAKELPCGATGDLVTCTKVDSKCTLAPTGKKAVAQCR